MKKWFKNNKHTLLGVILGAISGFLYYYFVGCASDSCGITSNPINSTLYFSVLGGLVVNIIKPNNNNDSKITTK